MFKKFIQNIFKPHSWRLLQDGYHSSDKSKINFKSNYFNKFDNNAYCEENSDHNNYFERSLNDQLKEFLIVGKLKIKPIFNPNEFDVSLNSILFVTGFSVSIV